MFANRMIVNRLFQNKNMMYTIPKKCYSNQCSKRCSPQAEEYAVCGIVGSIIGTLYGMVSYEGKEKKVFIDS